MTTIPKLPQITPELTEAVGFVVLIIVIAFIIANLINHWQSKSEAEQLRENAEDIIDFMNRRDNCYGE